MAKAKPNPRTDLSGLLGAASKSRDIERPKPTETPAPQDTATQEPQNTATPQPQDAETPKSEAVERRVNVAVREALHKPLRIYSVKSGRQVRDLVEEALYRYLKDVGEIE